VAPFGDMFGLFKFGLTSGLHVDWMVYIIAGFQLLVLIQEFIVKGEWKKSDPMTEMFAPYTRIIVLHIGIFAGAGALFLLGQPMVGVLALIIFRAAYGILSNSSRFGPEASIGAAMEKLGGRDKFEKLLKGQDPNAPPT